MEDLIVVDSAAETPKICGIVVELLLWLSPTPKRNMSMRYYGAIVVGCTRDEESPPWNICKRWTICILWLNEYSNRKRNRHHRHLAHPHGRSDCVQKAGREESAAAMVMGGCQKTQSLIFSSSSTVRVNQLTSGPSRDRRIEGRNQSIVVVMSESRRFEYFQLHHHKQTAKTINHQPKVEDDNNSSVAPQQLKL